MDSTTNYKYINIHSHQKPQLKDEIVVRNAYLRLSAGQIEHLPYSISVGLHPWHVHTMNVNDCADKLIEIASSEKVLAIGEIGVDRSIEISVNTQFKYFETQLNVARALQKPVIIHAVRSYSDIIPYLKKTKVPFIFHQFQGNEQQAKELLKHNSYLSFGSNLFDNKVALVFQKTPLEHIFLETDTSTQMSIHDIYKKAALQKEIEIDELKSMVFHNFANLIKNQ